MERMTDLDEVLSKDGEPNVACITGQPIEHRQNRPRRGVLDGNDETVDIATLEGVEGSRKASMPDVVRVREQLSCCAIAVAVGFSLISDDHASRRYQVSGTVLAYLSPP